MPFFGHKIPFIKSRRTRNIFSINTNKSTNRKCIDSIICSFFVCKNFFDFWWNSKSKFQNSHTSQTSCNKMPEFVNHYNHEKNQKCKQNSKYNIHFKKIFKLRFFIVRFFNCNMTSFPFINNFFFFNASQIYRNTSR